ncbi:hypothetical protein [Micromonospora sp. CB01531]|uniref:hypothetical protein n=1 Tax=Micromonospora sp. CB01531 TaxID=1718947 RepID=UPI00093C6366|nr:hypothetical protein [Micromonospora sp. CB01531]OKI54517.1 hypothetical protein A6A27_31830 [Micromonospora sp. CB01531]
MIHFEGGNLIHLVEEIEQKVDYLLRRCWMPSFNNQWAATQLSLYLVLLEKSGYDTQPVYDLWKERYEAYKAQGGRAHWVSLGH